MTNRTWMNVYYPQLAEAAHSRGLEVRNAKDEMTKTWHWQVLMNSEEQESLYDVLPEAI